MLEIGLEYQLRYWQSDKYANLKDFDCKPSIHYISKAIVLCQIFIAGKPKIEAAVAAIAQKDFKNC
jgi:hypothetical protein